MTPLAASKPTPKPATRKLWSESPPPKFFKLSVIFFEEERLYSVSVCTDLISSEYAINQSIFIHFSNPKDFPRKKALCDHAFPCHPDLSPGFHISSLSSQICLVCCHCNHKRAESLSAIDRGFIWFDQTQTLEWGSFSQAVYLEGLLTSKASSPGLKYVTWCVYNSWHINFKLQLGNANRFM